MYLLVLLAFFHLEEPREHVVLKAFKSLDECRAMAMARNRPPPFGIARQPGDVFVCVKVEPET
jgi:hypothetical protein